MNSKIFKWIILCIFILLTVGIFFKVTSAQEKLTGGEFAVKIVESLGLDYKIKEGAAPNDYITLLEEEGFSFPENFDPAKPITEEQKAALLSQILTLDEIKKQKAQVEAYRNKAVIEKIIGNAMVKPEGTDQWIPAVIDMKLSEGDSIKTGPGSTIFLRVGVVGKIEIKENSELLLKTLATKANKKSENILIYLTMGETSIDVRHIDKETTFETHTPTSIAAVRGTVYIVKILSAEGKTEITNGE